MGKSFFSPARHSLASLGRVCRNRALFTAYMGLFLFPLTEDEGFENLKGSMQPEIPRSEAVLSYPKAVLSPPEKIFTCYPFENLNWVNVDQADRDYQTASPMPPSLERIKKRKEWDVVASPFGEVVPPFSCPSLEVEALSLSFHYQPLKSAKVLLQKQSLNPSFEGAPSFSSQKDQWSLPQTTYVPQKEEGTGKLKKLLPSKVAPFSSDFSLKKMGATHWHFDTPSQNFPLQSTPSLIVRRLSLSPSSSTSLLMAVLSSLRPPKWEAAPSSATLDTLPLQSSIRTLLSSMGLSLSAPNQLFQPVSSDLSLLGRGYLPHKRGFYPRLEKKELLHKETMPDVSFSPFSSSVFSLLEVNEPSFQMVNQSLYLRKKEGTPSSLSLDVSTIPFVKEKGIFPAKRPVIPKEILEDLPKPGILVELMRRSRSFPYTQSALKDFAAFATPEEVSNTLSYTFASPSPPSAYSLETSLTVRKSFSFSLSDSKPIQTPSPSLRPVFVNLPLSRLPQITRKVLETRFASIGAPSSCSSIPIEEKEAILLLSLSFCELRPPMPTATSLSLLGMKEPSLQTANESLGLRKKKETLVSLSIDALKLPFVNDKGISPATKGAIPQKILEDLPNPGALIELTHRSPSFPYTQSTLKAFAALATPEKISSPFRYTFDAPTLPAVYPLESPRLVIQRPHVSIKKAAVKNQNIVDTLSLPPLSKKRMTTKKSLTLPHQAIEGLLIPKNLLSLTLRSPSFPNTQKLLENPPAPSYVHAETPIAYPIIEEPNTQMILSQAKRMLKDYDHRNQVSSEFLTLATSGEPPVSLIQEVEKRSSRFTSTFLTEIPPPSCLETITYRNEFDADVYYSKAEEGEGYSFAIKMKPKRDLYFASPYQNILFVIDGSSTIKKSRFGVFKEGVRRSLPYLRKGDSFNIIVADAEMTSFQKKAALWNKETVAEATRFLNGSQYRGFFTNYHSFDILEKIRPFFDSKKENVIVLITDGNSLSSFKRHKKHFQALREASGERFSIFAATASQNNNLKMLDLISTFSSGELMYSKTHAAFPRKLAVLVKHIENLVAKNLRVHVATPNPETKIDFYPNQKLLPSLYSDRPYTIYGTTDTLEDFDLILQGRAGKQWIHIKQHISFKKAEKTPEVIKKQLASQKAYICYDYYLKKDDPFFLNEAEKNLPSPAFQ